MQLKDQTEQRTYNQGRPEAYQHVTQTEYQKSLAKKKPDAWGRGGGKFFIRNYNRRNFSDNIQLYIVVNDDLLSGGRTSPRPAGELIPLP